MPCVEKVLSKGIQQVTCEIRHGVTCAHAYKNEVVIEQCCMHYKINCIGNSHDHHAITTVLLKSLIMTRFAKTQHF